MVISYYICYGIEGLYRTGLILIAIYECISDIRIFILWGLRIEDWFRYHEIFFIYLQFDPRLPAVVGRCCSEPVTAVPIYPSSDRPSRTHHPDLFLLFTNKKIFSIARLASWSLWLWSRHPCWPRSRSLPLLRGRITYTINILQRKQI